QPTIECLDCLDIEFGPDTGVQQASILFEDAYCDYDRIQVPIRCTGEQPTIECLDCLDIEFGPDTGVQQASILFEDAYCDYDRIQVPIRCTGEVEPKKTKA
uniref:CTCK domain-containing protein n=1 Tax=Bursaphelenchus xylophilus TaxID=6326 RepID=A0A1I7SN84_BURXY